VLPLRGGMPVRRVSEEVFPRVRGQPVRVLRAKCLTWASGDREQGDCPRSSTPAWNDLATIIEVSPAPSISFWSHSGPNCSHNLETRQRVAAQERREEASAGVSGQL
jgi:hypothetical protein